jgi:hypothetical protein
VNEGESGAMRMVDDLFNTLIEAVPEPMLHLDAAG